AASRVRPTSREAATLDSPILIQANARVNQRFGPLFRGEGIERGLGGSGGFSRIDFIVGKLKARTFERRKARRFERPSSVEDATWFLRRQILRQSQWNRVNKDIPNDGVDPPLRVYSVLS